MGAMFSLIGLSLISAFFTISSSVVNDKPTLIRFPSKPAVLAVKKRRNGDQKDAGAASPEDIEHVSLRHLVETRCQSLFQDFRPIWYLFKYVLRWPCVYLGLMMEW